MRALTIIQPYPSLIALPDDHPRAKRVENRFWKTSYRGDLAIHAGKSRLRLDEAREYDLEPSAFVFGAIVAVATLADCIKLGSLGDIPAEAIRRRPWLCDHEHVEGPWCWVLTEVRPLASPVHCQGEQGLWTPAAEIVEVVRGRLGEAAFL